MTVSWLVGTCDGFLGEPVSDPLDGEPPCADKGGFKRSDPWVRLVVADTEACSEFDLLFEFDPAHPARLTKSRGTSKRAPLIG